MGALGQAPPHPFPSWLAVNVNDSMRIVHVAETIKGGIATYLRNVLPLQSARYGRENIRVLVPASQEGELAGAGVAVHSFSQHRSRPVTALAAAWKLRAQLTAFRPAIVHIHSSFAGLTCRPVLHWAPHHPRVVYCPHGWAFTRVGGAARIAEWIEQRLSRLCDAIVCVSDAERSAALAAGLSSAHLRMILNGLPDYDRSPIAGPSAGAPLRLLFAGRFDRAKGFDVLVAALKRLQRPVQVDAFGESVLGENAVSEIPGSIRLRGWQPFSAMAPFLQRCDAVVMPSRWEGLPMSAIEAMRAGKAVIASRVGGLRELVEEGVTGLLVPPDDPVVLAETLERIQRHQLIAMGAMGRKRFLEKFRVETCEAQLAALYEELLTRKNFGTEPR